MITLGNVRAGSRPAGLHRDRAESGLGGRHHVRSDLGRVPLSRHRAGCLQAPDRRLGDGHAPQNRPRPRRIEHGPRAAPAPRRDSPFGPGLSICSGYDNAMAESLFATLGCELSTVAGFGPTRRRESPCSATSKARTIDPSTEPGELQSGSAALVARALKPLLNFGKRGLQRARMASSRGLSARSTRRIVALYRLAQREYSIRAIIRSFSRSFILCSFQEQ